MIAHPIHTHLRIHQGATTDDIATATGIARERVMRALKYGRTIGVINSEQVGREWRHYLAREMVRRPDVQVRVLAAIRRGLTTRGVIADALKVARSTVHTATIDLERAGLINIHVETTDRRVSHRLSLSGASDV